MNKLIEKYKYQYKTLKPSDIRKVSRAVTFISNQGKVQHHSIANFVDGNDWYCNRSSERLFLAQDVLQDMNLISSVS